MYIWVLGSFIYLATGYIIGILAYKEQMEDKPIDKLTTSQKYKRFFLFPASTLLSLMTGKGFALLPSFGLLEGKDIIYFAIFFWPLRYLPGIQVMFKIIFLIFCWVLSLLIENIIKAIIFVFDLLLGSIFPRLKYHN